MSATRRAVLCAAAACPLAACGRAAATTPAGGTPAAAQTAQSAQAWSAVVDPRFGGPDGAPSGEAGRGLAAGVKTYTTVGAALRAPLPEGTGAARPYVVFIRNGRYREKLTVSRPFTTLLGESRAGTVLTYDDSADSKSAAGAALGTSGSASLAVAAPDFRAERLTIENAFDYLRNRARPEGDPARVANAQAVALKLDRGSDRAVLRDVAIAGYQDTLLADAGRSYFRDCTVSGSTDFIFGAGVAVFDRCQIVSRDLGSRSSNGYITAASTPLSSRYGFVFLDCRLRKETPAMADGSVALGRPWHPTTTLPDGSRAADPNAVASVVYLRCAMDGHVGSGGWESMSGRDKDGWTITFLPQDARFFEYGSSGPGAIRSDARRQLSDAEAQQITVSSVLGGWTPT